VGLNSVAQADNFNVGIEKNCFKIGVKEYNSGLLNNHTNARAAHDQSTGIRVVKSSASATQCITKYIINGGVQCKFVV
jgi:hypothetical protein